MHLSMQLKRLPEAEKNGIACLSSVYNFAISYLNHTMNPMKNAKLFCHQIGPEWLRPSAGGGSVAPILRLVARWARWVVCWKTALLRWNLGCAPVLVLLKLGRCDKFMNQRRRLMWTAVVRIVHDQETFIHPITHMMPKDQEPRFTIFLWVKPGRKLKTKRNQTAYCSCCPASKPFGFHGLFPGELR